MALTSEQLYGNTVLKQGEKMGAPQYNVGTSYNTGGTDAKNWQVAYNGDLLDPNGNVASQADRDAVQKQFGLKDFGYDTTRSSPQVDTSLKTGQVQGGYTDNSTALQNAIVNQSNQPTQAINNAVPVVNNNVEPVTNSKLLDNSTLINDQYASLVSALKSHMQQGINNKQQSIDGLGAKYQPQKDTSEVSKANQLRTALEISANAGDRGGNGRQDALDTQTAGDNRLNAINLQQTGDETSLKNDIANLVLEGNVQEAQLKSQQLKDLIANNQYVDSTIYNRGRDQIGDNRYTAETAYNQGRDAIGDKRYDIEYKDTRGDVAYNRDYQAGRDSVADTGKLSNGTYTQAGQRNATDQKLADYNYTQQTDPNSTKNIMDKLGLDTAQLNFNALPQKIKDDATRVAQDIENGRISNEEGKYKLNELTNPDSTTNKLIKMGFDTTEFNFKNLAEDRKNEVTKITQDLENGRISNEEGKYKLEELTNVFSTTNMLRSYDLSKAQSDKDESTYEKEKRDKELKEWENLAPQRKAKMDADILKANNAEKLAAAKIKAENEDLLLKQIERKYAGKLNDAELAKRKQDIAESKASIDAKVRASGLDERQFNETVRNHMANEAQARTNSNNAKAKAEKSKTEKEKAAASTVVSAAYSAYLNSPDKKRWLNENVKHFTDPELKAFNALANRIPGEKNTGGIDLSSLLD